MTRFLSRTVSRTLLVAGAVLPASIPSASAQDIKTMHGKIMGEAHIQMSSTDKAMMAKMMGQMNASDKEVYASMSMSEKMRLMKMKMKMMRMSQTR